MKNILGVKVHLTKQASVAVLTATITEEELKTVKKALSRKHEPFLLAEGPIRRNAKICTFRRPSSDVDFLGRTLSDGTWQPGMLQVLKTLHLDNYVEWLKNGAESGSCPRTMIFFR